MRKNLFVTMALALFATAGIAQAADVGPYVGASAGKSGVKTDEGISTANADFDEEDTAWKAFAGYRFGLLGIEGGYVDLGSPENGDLQVDVTGWNLFGTLNFGLGPATLFAKAGVIDWDQDTREVGLTTRSESGTDPAYGVGASFALTDNVDLRAEYEVFDLENTDNVRMWSAGIEIGF